MGGPRQRAVLGALLIRANEAVTVDYLAAAAWQRQPASLLSNLRTYMANLRRLLTVPGEADPRLISDSDGYRLVVRPGELDLVVFDDLANRAGSARRRGDLVVAADLYLRALALWRGSLLAGLPVGPALETEVTRLDESRLRVVEQHIDTRMLLGEQAELVSGLRALVREHPFRERFAEQLMLALHQSGRQAEALEIYRQTRQRVVSELGIEPGPQLQQLHQEILVGTPMDPPAPAMAAPAVPAELPNAAVGFTGRRTELDRLDRLVGNLGETVVIAVISGTAGVGKTALAMHWAHGVPHRFPDGQLFIDLGGYGAERLVGPDDALGRLLRSLGVPPARIPTGLDALIATYRTVIAGRRVLIVLDNVRTAEQVRPLLPGRAGCVVVVTSRDTLTGLVARDGAHPITLAPLTMAESLTLLGRILDDRRVDTEPSAAAELVRLCGHLPLALRLAAARLYIQPRHTIRALTARVRRDRLTTLQARDDPLAGVRLAFDHSYRALDEPVRRLFRRLALVPGPDLTGHVAAALIDTTLRDVESLLDSLTSTSLLDEPVAGRYRLHDLLRDYAAERTGIEDTAEERRAAIRRVLEWYQGTADAATGVLDPHRRRAVRLDSHSVNRLTFTAYEDALAWCAAEHVNLTAAVRLAAEHDMQDLAWQLPISQFGFLELSKHWSDWISTHELGLASARQVGARVAEAWILNSLGIAHKQVGELRRAIDYYRAALAIRREIDDRHGQAITSNNLGIVVQHSGRPEEALGHYEYALAIFCETGDRWGEGVALTNLGETYRHLGSLGAAASHFRQSLSIRSDLGDRRGAAITLHNLAETSRAQGRPSDAIGLFREALHIRREIGDQWGVARTLTGLGRTLVDTGDPAEARRYWQQALDIFRDLGDPQTAEVQGLLDAV